MNPLKQRRQLSAVLVAGFGVLAAACGVPVSEEVEAISVESYPEIFVATSSSTTQPDADDATIGISLYFVSQDEVEEIIRPFVSKDLKPQDAVHALAEAPTEEEKGLFDDQLDTRLPAGLDPITLELDEDRLIYPLLLNPEVGFRQLTVEDSARASLIANQLVCTLTSLALKGDGDTTRRVNGIELFDSRDVDAEPIIVTDANLSAIEGPILPSHFNDCLTGSERRALEQQAEQGDEEP